MWFIGRQDVVLLVGAAAIWVGGSYAVRWLYRRTHDERGPLRVLWVWLRALAAGAGVWAATVIAFLAYRPDFSWTLDPWAAALALLMGVIVAVPVLIGRAPVVHHRSRMILGASFNILAFTLVHFAVILGVEAQATLHWSASYQAVGVLALAACIYSSWFVRTRRWPGSGLASIAISLTGISALHFISLAGLVAEPIRQAEVAIIFPSHLYAAVIAACFVGLVSLAAAAYILSTLAERKGLLRLRSATNAMPHALALFDASDRLVAWNRVFEETVGEVAGGLREGLPLPVVFARYGSNGMQPKTGAAPVRRRRSMELETPSNLRIRVDDIPTEDGGLLVMGTDVTDMRRSQDALAEALERAEAASRAKSEFLATMSHEIRTPLNGVLGMAQALAGESLSSSQREKLEVIQQGGQALLSVLNNILDLSKIEAGGVQLEDGVVDIALIARQVQAIFSAIAAEKDIGLEVSVSAEAEGQWRGDPTRVQQILQNLVSNAVKFTERGRVAISVDRLDGALLVRVSDSGPGVPPAFRAQVFQPFTQADASTTRRFGGSGLGLSICRDLARLMGGDIDLESRLGHGSTFIVRLPLEPIAAPAGGSRGLENAEPPSLAGLRVLAAEDNEMNQLVLRTLLQPFGVDTHVVANGAEAVAAWEAGGWAVVLMDVQMPVMDGPGATALIRAREQELGLPRTPIIALTANAMSHHTESYLAGGMDEVVAKPLNIAELANTILRVRSRALEAAPETAPVRSAL